MPRWSKWIKKYRVKVQKIHGSNHRVTLPKPLVDIFGDPDAIIFEVTSDGKVIVYPF